MELKIYILYKIYLKWIIKSFKFVYDYILNIIILLFILCLFEFNLIKILCNFLPELNLIKTIL